MELLNERAFSVWLTVAALGTRLYLAGTLVLDPDESMHLAAGSTAAWAAFHHPPLLLFWLWAASLVSEREWWLRLPPVIAGGLTPLVLGFWLRRFLSPVPAWGLAAIVALSPVLVHLTMQLRGYSMAMLGVAAAFYTLDRALDERSIRWMLWHFLALYLAILAEFSVAWIALAAGPYALARFWREPVSRSLVWVWTAGQLLAAALYAALLVLVVKPLLAATNPEVLIQSYLSQAFPAAGGSLLAFALKGTAKQFEYILNGKLTGGIGAIAAGVGLYVWIRRGDLRWVLVLSSYLAILGAIGRIFPFGRSRHTVVIGLLSLAATGAGIDSLSRRNKQAATAIIGFLFFLACVLPARRVVTTNEEHWAKHRLARALEKVESEIPPGATLLVNQSLLYQLQIRWRGRAERTTYFENRPLKMGGRFVLPGPFDWSRETPAEIRARAEAVKGPVWFLDGGYETEENRNRLRQLGLTAVVDEPGVLFTGRLR